MLYKLCSIKLFAFISTLFNTYPNNFYRTLILFENLYFIINNTTKMHITAIFQDYNVKIKTYSTFCWYFDIKYTNLGTIIRTYATHILQTQKEYFYPILTLFIKYNSHANIYGYLNNICLQPVLGAQKVDVQREI